MNKPITVYLLSVATFALTLFFFAPFSTYFNNVNEYNFLFPPILRTLSLIGLAAVFFFILLPLILIFILTLIKRQELAKTLIKTITLIYCFFSLMFWLQGTLLALNLGVLDGRPIPWEQHLVPVYLNLAVWVFLTVFSVIHRQRLAKFIVPVSLILIVMQTANFISQYLTLPQPASFKLYTTDGTHQNTLSTQKNVVMILLDTFQSDIFEEIIYQNPEVKDQLQGFTYYNDVAGGYPTTYPSIPLIMTGQFYQNQEPIQDYIQQAYLSKSSLPKNLKDMGFNVYIPCIAPFYCDQSIADSFVEKPSQTWLKKAELPPLLKPTAIRYLPSIVYMAYQKNKSTINESINRDLTPIDNTPDLFKHDFNLLQSILKNSATSSAQPAFRYYHFTAPHPPFYLNPQGEFESQPDNRQGQINHATGALNFALQIVDKYRQLNIYDQTMLIILADHGYGLKGYKPHPEADIISDQPVIGAAMPLLLVKPFYSKDIFQTDNTSISYQTLSQDLIKYLSKTDETSTKAFIPTQTQPRHFYFYDWTDNWEALYLPELQPYIISSYIRHPKSWKLFKE